MKARQIVMMLFAITLLGPKHSAFAEPRLDYNCSFTKPIYGTYGVPEWSEITDTFFVEAQLRSKRPNDRSEKG